MSTIITAVSLGRPLTTAERATQDALLASSEADGTTNGTCATAIDRADGAVRIWTTIAAANTWVAMLEAMTPPPFLATVRII